jgi:hypothetical protein
MPADDKEATGSKAAATFSALAPLYPTKLGVYNLAHEKSWPALLDPPDPAIVPTEKPELPPVISRNFDCSRMAVIRSGSWQVYLHYGQLTRYHAEPDVLNFEAFYKETDVTHNPEHSIYASEMFKEYYKTPICHNVPLIDGEGEAQWNEGKLDSFGASSVTASQPEYRPNVQASRAVTIDGESLKDTVQVSTSDGNAHALGFLLHLTGKVANLPATFVAESHPEEIQDSKAFKSAVKYWKKVSSATFRDRASFDVTYDAVTMRINFELPGDFTVWHATVPDKPTRTREVFYLQTQGKAATLKTTFVPATPVAVN